MVSVRGLEVFGRHFREFQVTCISADRLIPFKAKAWLDLSQRKESGEAIDTRSVKKHRNDVLNLTGLLTGEVIKLPESITEDMALFLDRLEAEEIDFKALKIPGDLQTIIGRIAESFGLQVTR